VIFAKNNPDTVKIWLSNKEISLLDSVNVAVTYQDPNFLDSIKIDTLRLKKPTKLTMDTVLNLKALSIKEPNKDFLISANSPIKQFDNSKIRFEFQVDTIFTLEKFTLELDTIDLRNVKINSRFSENSKYRIIVEEGFLRDIYGISNIADTFKVNTSLSSEYGNLKISFTDNEKSYIVQIIQSEKVLVEMASTDGEVEFVYLKPGKYRIRAIQDINNNKRWDSGDLSLKKQAEPVYYFPDEYEIRSNWNHEVDWNPITNVSK
jgi:hypothetical protein